MSKNFDRNFDVCKKCSKCRKTVHKNMSCEHFYPTVTKYDIPATINYYCTVAKSDVTIMIYHKPFKCPEWIKAGIN